MLNIRWSNYALVILFCGLVSSAQAELVVLRSGGMLEGEILNPGRDDKEPLQLRSTNGIKLVIAHDQIQKVMVLTEMQKQYQQMVAQLPDTVEAHQEMQRWCQQAGLIPERHKHLEAILRLEPDHEPTRLTLGYMKLGSQWVKPDAWMHSQGYVRYQGRWRMRQEIEIDARVRQQELAEKQWRKDIRTWRENLTKPKYRDAALQSLKAINDPAAIPALIDIAIQINEPTELRLLALELLAKLPGNGTNVMIQLAINDKDPNIRDRCLEELKNRKSQQALAAFLKLLTDKSNVKVNRGAYCLERLEDPEATIPLIDALVTTHQYLVSAGGPPGGMSATFGNGGGGGGGLGGMSMGGKPKLVKRDEQNEMALAALSRLHPGANFGYNEEKWRAWYAETFTTSRVNLRRD